jgi:hypothetical protein
VSGFKLLITIIVILHAQKTSKAEALIYCELFLNKYFDCGCDNFLAAVMLDACLPHVVCLPLVVSTAQTTSLK